MRPEEAWGYGEVLTFWIMMLKGPSIWNPRAKYMTLHQPSTRESDMGTASPLVLVSLITMVTSTREAEVMLGGEKGAESERRTGNSLGPHQHSCNLGWRGTRTLRLSFYI